MKKIITVKKNEEYIEIIEKSKFISKIYHIKSEEEAKKIIEEIKEKYNDATHNCFAYVVRKYRKI